MLIKQLKNIEEEFNTPIDIEWGIETKCFGRYLSIPSSDDN